MVPFGTWSENMLNAQFYEVYSYFSPFNCWVIFFFFLLSKLDVQCMVIAKKEQNKILFQNLFKLMFNKYNKQCKVGEGHLNSYFYKKSKFYKVCNDSKSNVCFNIMVGFGNWNIKIQLTLIEIWIAYYWFY